ncbi:MAG: YtxH domain-containing protein [Acidobacteriia bacterium]|nr:YtxH domain-containing protein [Terriglobia bacterium]
MKAFLFGLGLGIGLGVLFAPMSGEEARNNLQERAQDLTNSARKTYEKGRERVQRRVSSICSEGGSATGTEAGA